uniref:Permease YjgP/YjgQ family protein n=1 Tax=Cyanidium sp. THAL103 TaxID=3027999 RepID=A0A9Y1I451_9RHOD|nr:hypothetical protein CspTHAL103_079 [Cyanidium sp. THAL103]
MIFKKIVYYLNFRILDIYIFKKLFIPFISILMLFLGLALSLGTVLEILREMINGLPLNIALQLFFLKIPVYISFLLPVSCLFAGFIGYLLLNSTKQLLGIHNFGFNLARCLKPSFFFSICVAYFSWQTNEFIVPFSNYTSELLYENILNNFTEKQRFLFKNYEFLESINNKVDRKIIHLYNYQDRKIHNLFMIDFIDQDLYKMSIAKSVSFNSKNMYWVAKELVVYTKPLNLVNNIPSLKMTACFSNCKITDSLLINEILLEKHFQPSWMNINSLKSYKNLINSSIQNHSSLKINFRIYQKYNLPITCVLMHLIGSLIGSLRYVYIESNLIFILLSMFGYYIILFVSEILSMDGWISPILGAFIPNILMFIIIISLIKRLN